MYKIGELQLCFIPQKSPNEVLPAKTKTGSLAS